MTRAGIEHNLPALVARAQPTVRIKPVFITELRKHLRKIRKTVPVLLSEGYAERLGFLPVILT